MDVFIEIQFIKNLIRWSLEGVLLRAKYMQKGPLLDDGLQVIVIVCKVGLG